jgi:hypothetical protein
VARAGFWPIGGYLISFRADGHWYADDEIIGNERIARLFSQHVQYDENDGWVIDLGIDRQAVTVEDTGLVVVAVRTPGQHQSAAEPDGDTIEVRTNDGVVSVLDPTTLEVGDGNVLYCEVDRGQRGVIRARFLRPAYYALAEKIEDSSEGPVLVCDGKRHRIELPS